MPRSLAFCYHNILESLDFLTENYSTRHPCHETASRTAARLRTGTIKDVFDAGLHEFLADFIRDNNRLGDAIAADYRFH
jgi:uncharacterized alpha-E superfamily protein